MRPGPAAVHETIYLRGQSYEVVELDLRDQRARVVECDNTTYTSPGPTRTSGSCGLSTSAESDAAPHRRGQVTTQVLGYQLRDVHADPRNETLDLPEQRLVTRTGTSSTTT